MIKFSHRLIKIKDLTELALTAKTDKIHYPFLPITEIRAISQVKNPIASEEDFALLIIYCDSICVGYLGLLPCLLKYGLRVNKVYAFSAFFVDPEYRKFKIAHRIMKLAFSLNYDFFFSGYTDAFYKFSLKNPQWFKKIHDTSFLQINLDLMFPVFVRLEEMRRNKKNLFSKKPLLFLSRLCLFIIRKISHNNFIRNWRIGNLAIEYSGKKNIVFRPIEKVKPLQVQGVICSFFEGSHYFYRDTDTMNWMIQNPWITEKQKLKSKYFFSAWRKQFRYLAYGFYSKKNNHYLGYVVFSISTRGGITTLSILDSEVVKKEYLVLVLEQALQISINSSVDKILIPEYFSEIINAQKNFQKLSIKKRRGNFLCPTTKTVFPSDYRKLKLQFCEGDIPFT